MKRLYAATIVAINVLAAITLTGCSAKPVAQIFTCTSYQATPKEFTPYCADAGQTFTKVSWSYWGSSYANGTGKAATNLCEPTCAAGKTDITDADVTADTPITVGDKTVFSRLVIKYHDKVTGHPMIEKLSLPTAPMGN